MPILFLEPIFKKRIWGGNYFQKTLNYPLDNDLYGEMWSLSAHPEGLTLIKNGEFQGKSLNEIFLKKKEWFNSPKKEFPLMIKLIHTEDKLSVQVHPDNLSAKLMENQLGKTECWYFLDAEKDAQIVLGHKASTIEELASAIKEGKCEEQLIYHTIKPHDFALIPSRTVHALGSGLLLLEIQQSSDVTYRLYDYNRLGLDGKLRELHVEKGLKVIDFPQKNIPQIINFNNDLKEQTIVDGEFFKIDLIKIDNGLTYVFKENTYHLITCLKGEIQIEDTPLKLGESAIATIDVKKMKIKGNGEILISIDK